MASPPYVLDKQNLGSLNLDELNAMIAQLYALVASVPAVMGALVTDAAPGSGPVNNYTPAGFGATTGRLEITPPAGGTIINSLPTGYDGQVVIVSNRSATDPLQFNNEAAGSTAAMRIQTAGDFIAMAALGNAFLYYNGGTINRWRVL